MSVTGAHSSRFQGGLCYSLCQETFSWYNPSINMCWKGCDYAKGRANDPVLRKEADNMCKRLTAELMWTNKGELDNLEDLRVYADMYPKTPREVYKACLAGIRRQKY